MKEVFLAHPDDGESAFPDNLELADLWDRYIAEVRAIVLDGLVEIETKFIVELSLQ